MNIFIIFRQSSSPCVSAGTSVLACASRGTSARLHMHGMSSILTLLSGASLPTPGQVEYTGVLLCCDVVDTSVVAQWQIPMVFLRFSSCSTYGGRRLCAGPASSCVVVGDSRDPTVAARFFLDQVVDMPVVCNDRCHGGRCSGAVHRQDMDVPVIMRGSGSAPDSVHRGIGGHSSSQQRLVLDSQQWKR